MTVQSFEDKVLRGALHMISPDVMVDDGKGTVLISSEEGETTENMSKSLSVRTVSNISFFLLLIYIFSSRFRTLTFLMVRDFDVKISIKNMI